MNKIKLLSLTLLLCCALFTPAVKAREIHIINNTNKSILFKQAKPAGSPEKWREIKPGISTYESGNSPLILSDKDEKLYFIIDGKKFQTNLTFSKFFKFLERNNHLQIRVHPNRSWGFAAAK